MSRPLSRRTALCGSVAASLGLAAGVASAAVGGKSPSTEHRASAEVPHLSANDRRLVELADTYVKLDAMVDALHSTAAGFDDLVAGFQPIEDEMARTEADTMAGILAKARACQLSVLRDCEEPVSLSVADDVWRLFGGGAHA